MSWPSSRPVPSIGQYWRTRDDHPKIKCIAYTAPPSAHRHGDGGAYICTIAPGTTLGPVETWLSTPNFVTVLVREYWINVWHVSSGRNGRECFYAHPIPDQDCQAWRDSGWVDLD